MSEYKEKYIEYIKKLNNREALDEYLFVHAIVWSDNLIGNDEYELEQIKNEIETRLKLCGFL